MTESVYVKVIPGKYGGRYSVRSHDPRIATALVVRRAMECGETPPKWWQFWREKWSPEALAEYRLQTGEK